MAESGWTADRRLYLDAEGNVVEADDPKRATLLVGKGGRLTKEQVEEHGIKLPKAAAKAEDKAEEQPPETKHRSGPAETKGKG